MTPIEMIILLVLASPLMVLVSIVIGFQLLEYRRNREIREINE